MPEAYLTLPRDEQANILLALAPELGRTPEALEKDVWVCWVLKKLFTMPDRLQMVFKGGTSPSKAYHAIDRFSEDVDITLDYRSYETDFDPFATGVSKTRQKVFAERLKARVAEHVATLVAPYFRAVAGALLGDEARVEAGADGESLRFTTRAPSPSRAATSSITSSLSLVAATSRTQARRSSSCRTSPSTSPT